MKKVIKIYVSLPITGQENTVMERCLKAKQQIEMLFATADTKGYELEVVHPLDIDKIGTPEQDNTKPLSYWIGEDIKLLMECDAVFFCKGNSRSRGCQLEHRCATLYEKTILNQCYPIADNVFELEELISELDKQGMKTEKTVICVAQRGRNPDRPTSRESGLPTVQMIEPNWGGTTNTITTVCKDNLILITDIPYEQLRKEWANGMRLTVCSDAVREEDKEGLSRGTCSCQKKD